MSKYIIVRRRKTGIICKLNSDTGEYWILFPAMLYEYAKTMLKELEEKEK